MVNDSQKKLFFSVKVGKSYKNRGWALARSSTVDLIPILPYEDECDIIVDGVPAKAHLNILPRIFYGKDEITLMNHLQQLSEEGSKDRIELQLLLNNENFSISDDELINELKYKLDHSEMLVKEFERKNIELTNRLKYYEDNYDALDNIKNLENKVIELEKNNDELKHKLENNSSFISDNYVEDLKDEIKRLTNKNLELEVVLAKLLKKMDEEKEIKDFVKELASKINNLNLD